jgi:hypothetical protein
LIILIFLRTHSAVNPFSVDFLVIFHYFISRISVAMIVSLSTFHNISYFSYTSKMCKCRRNFTYHSFCEWSQKVILLFSLLFNNTSGKKQLNSYAPVNCRVK